MNKLSIISLLLSILSFSAYAEDPNMGNEKHHFHPQEGINACSGKANADTCSFTGPGGHSLEGTCRQGPDGKGVMACAPKPPKEAVDACTGKTEGNDCSFIGRNNNNITGLCRKAPGGEGDLVCFPKFGPPKPEGQNGDKGNVK
jgi:hypothetical protein